MTIQELTLKPSRIELRELVRLRHGAVDPDRYGWATRLRLRFDYYTPDEVYEATVARLVGPDSAWLDVGCGRSVFLNHPDLARALAGRCAILVGVDPDPTIEENTIVHQRVRGTIDSYQGDRKFDVVTLRMVAEHITDPESTVAALARLTRPVGRVVVYTVNRWSPVTIASRIIPFRWHHPIKRRLWNSEEKDTFPVTYRMNTRRRLRRLFEEHGFRESSFSYLDDCRTFGNSRPLLALELLTWRMLRVVGLKYPENCLLGIYERLPTTNPSP